MKGSPNHDLPVCDSKMRKPIPDHQDNGPDAGIFGINSQVVAFVLGALFGTCLLVACYSAYGQTSTASVLATYPPSTSEEVTIKDLDAKVWNRQKRLDAISHTRMTIAEDTDWLPFCLDKGRGTDFIGTKRELEGFVNDDSLPGDVRKAAKDLIEKFPNKIMIDRLKAIIGGAK